MTIDGFLALLRFKPQRKKNCGDFFQVFLLILFITLDVSSHNTFMHFFVSQ